MTSRVVTLAICALALAWAPVGGAGTPWSGVAGPRAACADALESGPLPGALWWRAAARPSLSHDPLGVLLDGSRIALEQEWAPLYSDRSGARIESGRRSLAARAPIGRLRTAVLVENRTLVAMSPAGDWRFGAERLSGERALAALGFEGTRGGIAVAAGAAEWRPGAALAGQAVLAPGWRAGANWSRWNVGGAMDIRWNDEHVAASARWVEQRAGWRLEWENGQALGARLEQRAINCEPQAFAVLDRAGPERAWRATRLAVRWPALGTVWQAEGTLGEGREELRFWRDGAPYALASGPVRREDVALHVAPGLWDVRAWGGRWRGEARGAVALWPFDGLAGAVGSRRVASSEATLQHAGLSLERVLGTNRLWESGLAIAWLSPRSSWESWQAPLLGLGRSDETSGVTRLRDALALGAKLATRVVLGRWMVRAEVVQWVPVMVREDSRAAQAPASPGASGGSAGGSSGSGAHGGTIVRLAFEGMR